MKNKKLLSLVAGVALLSNFALAGLAFAETQNSDQPINTVGLSIANFPALENLPAVNASSGAITSTHSFAGAINIRGAVTLTSGVEFSVTGNPWFNVTSGGGGYGNSFVNTALSMQTATPGGVTAIGTPSGVICSTLDDVISDTALPAGGDQTAGAGGASGSLKLIDEAAANTSVNFDCVFNPQMSLAIPAGTPPGTYRSTLTFSLSDL